MSANSCDSLRMAIAGTVFALIVALGMLAGVLAMRRVMPANPRGLSARTAQVDWANEQAAREVRGR